MVYVRVTWAILANSPGDVSLGVKGLCGKSDAT